MVKLATIVEGDLLEAPTKYIAHQTNCITRRSAHLAKAVFDRFPYADVYSTRPVGYKDTPGTIAIRGDGVEQRFVINMFAQFGPGKSRDPKGAQDGIFVRKQYFFSCLKAIAEIFELESIAFPWRIGCGAAGGDWPTYHGYLNKFANHLDGKAEVFIYKLSGVE